MKRSLTEKQKKTFSLIAFIIFIAFMVGVTVFIGIPMVKLAKTPEIFREWVNGFGIWSRLIFVGMIVLQVIVALIPGEPLELAAGYAFGAVEGTLLCSAGILLGSLIVFSLVRKFGTKLVEIFFSAEKLSKLKFLKYSKKRNILIFIVFLIPGTPKDLLCYFAGLTDIKISMWILITIVARAPSIITSTMSGGALGQQSYLTAAIVFGATIAISLLGVLIYNKICEKHNVSK